MITVKKNDKLIFNSENGLKYDIEIININDFRPPEMKYAINLIDPDGNSYYSAYNDYYFCGEDFIQKCEREE